MEQDLNQEKINRVIQYCKERIYEIVSDARYDRSKPATVDTNAPLALMQVAWEVEVDTLKRIVVLLHETPTGKEPERSK